MISPYFSVPCILFRINNALYLPPISIIYDCLPVGTGW